MCSCTNTYTYTVPRIMPGVQDLQHRTLLVHNAQLPMMVSQPVPTHVQYFQFRNALCDDSENAVCMCVCVSVCVCVCVCVCACVCECVCECV